MKQSTWRKSKMNKKMAQRKMTIARKVKKELKTRTMGCPAVSPTRKHDAPNSSLTSRILSQSLVTKVFQAVVNRLTKQFSSFDCSSSKLAGSQLHNSSSPARQLPLNSCPLKLERLSSSFHSNLPPFQHQARLSNSFQLNLSNHSLAKLPNNSFLLISNYCSSKPKFHISSKPKFH